MPLFVSVTCMSLCRCCNLHKYFCIKNYILGHSYYWIGLTDQMNEGYWRWIHTFDVTKTYFWAPGNPHQNHSRNCADIFWLDHQVDEMGWFDWPCSYHQNFLCEKLWVLEFFFMIRFDGKGNVAFVPSVCCNIKLFALFREKKTFHSRKF